MLTYTQIKRYDNMPFEQYLALMPQGERTYSHSFLKSEISGQSPLFVATERVKLGSLVDAILTSPDTVNPADPQFRVACKIASAIKAHFNKNGIDITKVLTPQVSYLGKLAYRGLQMNVCGRLDWEIPNRAVLDLKVTAAKTDKEFAKIITYMGYPNQMFNYMGLSGTKVAYIVPYSTKANACLSIIRMEWSYKNSFWESSVLKFGK